MQSVRTLSELPTAGDVTGVTRFVSSLARSVVVKHGQATQVANFGNITTVTGTYQMLPSDGLVLAGNTTSYTVTLPAVANVVKGHTVFIKKTGASGTLTIEGSGAETIDGSANVATSTQHDLVALVMSGTAWSRINLAGTAAQQAQSVNSRTTTATVGNGETFNVLSGTNTYTLTLPDPTVNTGIIYRFKKTGASGTITLDTPGSETIDGQASFAVATQWMSVEIISDGTNWHIIQWQVVDPTP